MKIISIKNINTGQEVCGNYLDKEVDLSKCKFEVGEDLQIMFTNGKSFTHEVVESVIRNFNPNEILVETSRKLWIIEQL